MSDPRFPTEPWRVRETALDLEDLARTESLFALANGHIGVDPQTGQTGNSRFFAAGDACNGGATVVEAVRGGKLAARGVHEWLDRGWA